MRAAEKFLVQLSSRTENKNVAFIKQYVVSKTKTHLICLMAFQLS